MNNREKIVQASMELINEKGDRLEEITMRDICKRADVALGLINYYFGNKDNLIECCVEEIVNGVVEKFSEIRERTKELPPFQKLETLGNMTLSFLFEHAAVSKISILSDMRNPKEDDNTQRTYRAYLPLVSACRPDLDEQETEERTFCLISTMQQAFLRSDVIAVTQGTDLRDPEQRRAYHLKLLREIIGERV